MVKIKDHLHIAFGESAVTPPHVVVARPHAIDVAVQKVIQTPGAVCELAEAFRQTAGQISRYFIPNGS